MSTQSAVPRVPQLIAPVQVLLPTEPPRLQHWYALHTRPRHEKMVGQRLAERGVTTFLPPFLEIGQRVRIRSGALDGVEDILVGRSGDRTLVVSVNAIQRSLAVRLEGYEVETI